MAHRPSMEGLHAIADIQVTLQDITMDEIWKKLEPLIPAGDMLFHDPVPFKSAKGRRTTLSALYKAKYRENLHERQARAVVKWAQEHGEELITSAAGVRYATSKQEYEDWAKTQLRHAYSILRFWNKVAPKLAQEIAGQLNTNETAEEHDGD